jgi:hypothetical protein
MSKNPHYISASPTTGRLTESRRWEYVVKRPFLEAGQRGFIVGVEVEAGKSAKKAGRVDLITYPAGTTKKSIDDAYRRAGLAVEGIKRGQFIGSYERGQNTFHFMIDGRRLTIKKD